MPHTYARMCAQAHTWDTMKYPSNPSKWSEQTSYNINKRRKPANFKGPTMEGQMDSHGVPAEGLPLPRYLTFDDVQDRLVEAMLTCWRHPDRERGWLRVKAMWPDVMAEPGDHDARGGDLSSSDVKLRPASLTRRDITEMDEAFGWVDAVAPDDRKLIGLAVSMLARGKREVQWSKLLAAMGVSRGADGLRMRYGRAMTTVTARANGANPQGTASTG